MSTALLQCGGCLQQVQANLINYTPIADRLFRICPACAENAIKQGQGLQKWLLDNCSPKPVFDAPATPPRCELEYFCSKCVSGIVRCSREQHAPSEDCAVGSLCSDCETMKARRGGR